MAWTVGKDGIVRSTQIIPVEEIMFGHYLQRVFTENSSKIALIETKTGMQYTFAELFEICKSVAARIQQHGVKAGDHVLFCAETGLQSSIVQLALLLCHVTLVVTKPISTVYELRETLDKFSELKLIIGDKMSSTNLLQSTKVKIVEVNDLCKSGHHSEFQSPPNGDPKTDVMLMVMTSGSTGASKAVCLSHYYMLADKIQANSCFEQFLMFNPLSHLSGMICFLFTIISGETVFIAPESLKDDIEEFLDTCLKFKPLTILALPVMLNKITKYGATDKLKSMKRIITGGSYVSQGLVNEFQSLHPHINVENLFGSSEAGVNLRSISSDKIQHLSVLPNVEVKIVDVETEKILGANEIGMLYSRAPTMSLGYYKNEKATAEAFKDGWHVLGDLAYRDEEGRIFIVDRLKQMIKCMGYQVSPADLEVVLEKDDEVLQVLVCGLPHEEFGEAAAAFVVPRKTSNLPELRSRLMKEIEAKFIMQKHLHGGLYFVSSIPETDSGKASRKDMASMHLKKQIEYLE